MKKIAIFALAIILAAVVYAAGNSIAISGIHISSSKGFVTVQAIATGHSNSDGYLQLKANENILRLEKIESGDFNHTFTVSRREPLNVDYITVSLFISSVEICSASK